MVSPETSADSLAAPFRPQREHIGNIAINLVDSGQPQGGDAIDDPLLFIHGITATHAYWRYNLAYFAQRRRVIAIDLPGFGFSDRPDIPYSMPGFVALVGQLLDQKGLPSATLIGNSMGGMISMLFSLAHPTRTRKLVLVDPAGATFFWPRRLMSAGLALAHTANRALRTSLGGTDATPPLLPRVPPVLMKTLFKNVFPQSSSLADRYSKAYVDAVSSERYPFYFRAGFRAARSIVSIDLRERAREIAAPTLIIWGAKDRLVPAVDGKLLRERIAGSRLLIYSQSGHCPMVDQPDRFNRDVESFLLGNAVGR